jgi:hypothetical protein
MKDSAAAVMTTTTTTTEATVPTSYHSPLQARVLQPVVTQESGFVGEMFHDSGAGQNQHAGWRYGLVVGSPG